MSEPARKYDLIAIKMAVKRGLEICLSCALRDTYDGLGAVDTDGTPSVYYDSPEVCLTAKARYQEEKSLTDFLAG